MVIFGLYHSFYMLSHSTFTITTSFDVTKHVQLRNQLLSLWSNTERKLSVKTIKMFAAFSERNRNNMKMASVCHLRRTNRFQ
jgi:hypothetical protein